MKIFKRAKKAFRTNIYFITFLVSLYFIVLCFEVSLFYLFPLRIIRFTSAPELECLKQYSRGEGCYVHQAKNGDYIIIGEKWIQGSGYSGVLFIRTDSEGEVLLEKSIITQNGWDRLRCVCEADDVGFLVIAVGRRGKIRRAIYGSFFIKTDSLGNTLWTKFYEEISVSSMASTKDNGHVFCGNDRTIEHPSLCLFKIDLNGNIIWRRKINRWGYSIQQTQDKGFIIAGDIVSPFTIYKDFDIYILKVDSFGDSLWSKVYRSPKYDTDPSVQQTTDKGYIIAGSTQPNKKWSTAFIVFLIKTNNAGSIEWMKTYSGKGQVRSKSVIQSRDGGYFVLGDLGSYGRGGGEIYMMKVRWDGTLLWEKFLGYGSVNSAIQSTDNGFVITGKQNGMIFLARLKPEK